VFFGMYQLRRLKNIVDELFPVALITILHTAAYGT
jgi:hypothetical protein